MSDYIRYTERNKFGNADIIGVDSGELFKNLSNVQGVQLCDALNSFAELEDKIENGMLIELPCKVGDTVYHIEYFCKANGCSNDKQAICCGCTEMLKREHNKQTYVISEKKFELKDLSKINKTLYITQESAEAKIKELQEKE